MPSERIQRQLENNRRQVKAVLELIEEFSDNDA